MRTAKDFKFRFFIGIEGKSLRGEGSLDSLSTLRTVNSVELPIFQFTGMKDSEGKDIYEGDIISVDWECSITQIFVIEYCVKEGYPAFDLKGWEGEANGLSEISQCGHCIFKVIGNIYENPELLEDKS